MTPLLDRMSSRMAQARPVVRQLAQRTIFFATPGHNDEIFWNYIKDPCVFFFTDQKKCQFDCLVSLWHTVTWYCFRYYVGMEPKRSEVFNPGKAREFF